ncbi:MAG TPA: murein biosynthesis integral membrane protein MurJ [Burkholderiaceae bacterium]|jgi:putative peptidoglycan lipid II flippase|nr:murein biosynthesis integral membrane protein MurJ [Burkholderiaceae bacterium]
MNLLRALATVSGLTLLSRITGLVRENLTATLFGASALTDAFFIAFRLPNLLRRLFAEGAFSQAFVPMLAKARVEQDEAGFHGFVSRIATVLFWSLIVVSVAGVAGAPALVWLTGSGLARDPQAFDAAVVMTRWMFPYILFISMVSLSAGILNSWRQFAIPAFSPVLLNLSFIFTALLLSDWFDPPVYAMAAGVVLGGIAQLAIQVPALMRIGMLPRIGFDVRAAFADPATRTLLGRMAPAVLAVSAAQISLMINTHIASRLAAGSVSWINFGDRLMEFPTALLGVALGTVLLPSLSQASGKGDEARYRELLDWGLRLALVLAVPCALGLALMAEPLTALIFHYGKFRAVDVQMTSRVIEAYALGLPGLIAVKVLAPGFFARQDVRTPVRIALLVLVVTQMLNLLMVPWLAHAGLALSTSLAALLNAGLLMTGLIRRGAWSPGTGWWRLGGQVALAGGLMATLLALVVPRVDWTALGSQPLLRAAGVLGLVAAGGLVYGVMLLGCGLRPRQFLRREP